MRIKRSSEKTEKTKKFNQDLTICSQIKMCFLKMSMESKNEVNGLKVFKDVCCLQKTVGQIHQSFLSLAVSAYIKYLIMKHITTWFEFGNT